MKYLINIFNEYLDTEGQIEIEGSFFDRNKIFKELDLDGYNAAFDDWFDRRNKEQKAKAESILSFSENKLRFRKLKDILRDGLVVPFIGAGLSTASGYPGWTDFLYQILQETSIPEKEFDQLIQNGAYEKATQRLNDALPHGSFLELIENRYGYSQPLCGPVQKLPYLFPNMAITTNFDDVLERSYLNADLPFNQIVLGTESTTIESISGAGERVLVKLHGKANSSQNRVLTLSEYEKHYTAGNTIENVIATLSSQTMLFLGCSLSTDRTLAALTTIAQKRGYESSPRHYAIIRLKKDEDRLARRDHLTAANIFPLWIPEEEDPDDCIDALLTLLGEGIIDS